MKRRFLTLLILPLAIIGSVQAQHRMWGNPIGPYAYNPAGANVNDMGEIIASYYMTYVDAKQAPQARCCWVPHHCRSTTWALDSGLIMRLVAL